MLDPSKRFVTLVLALGILVLIAAIAIGERTGDRVIGQVTEKRITSIAPVTVTPAPEQSSGPYSPNWKRSQVLSAAADPQFPDPRIPPVPLPTLPPRPKATPAPKTILASPTPTPNPNLPIWRRAQPLPTPILPVGSPSPGASGAPGSPEPGTPSPEPKKSPGASPAGSHP
ncbi:MAG TPA: hypothetical protein VIG51_07225 [Candidatus Baltobacteraceae bacterium]